MAHVKAGEHEQAWRLLSPTTRSPRSTAASATTRARASATAPSSTARCRFTRSNGSWVIWRWSGRGVRSVPRRHRQARAGDRGGAERAVGRLPPRPARPRGRDSGCRAGAGRDDALRNPRLPAAARRAGGGDRPDRGALACASSAGTGSRTSTPSGARGASTPCSSRSARTCQAGRDPCPDAGRIVDAVSFLRDVAAGERPVIGRRVAVYGGGNTAMDAARVARRMGAEDALIVYRRTAPADAGARGEAADAEREGVRINWLRTITAMDGLRPEGRGDGVGRDRIPTADGAVRDPRGRYGDPRARARRRDTGFLRGVPGVEFDRDGTVRYRAR